MLKRINALFGAQDMTVGKPMSALLRFSIPLLIGNLAQQMYSRVDSMIAGRYVGDKALSPCLWYRRGTWRNKSLIPSSARLAA